MRFKRHFGLEYGLKQIDIAPLIDVLFLLLIFFMLTSSFLLQPVIKVDLPKVITSDSLKNGNIEISISAQNLVFLNGRQVTAIELKASIAEAAKRGQPVLIEADRSASLGKAVEIWDLCRDAGISKINIATRQE